MILEARKIAKKYERKGRGSNFFYALDPTDFSVPENGLIEVVGRSGSGKSTLLSILAGILRPSEGGVFFGGRDINSLSDEALSRLRNENFGFVPQGHSAVFSLNVLENVMLPALIFGGDSASAESRAKGLLERFGISEISHALPTELSGGELRRLSIARALVNAPKIVFADEPTNDLDDENSRNVLEIFREISKNSAVVMVTHDPAAERYADEIYRMDGGKLSKIG